MRPNPPRTMSDASGSSAMTVRDATIGLLRRLGMTTVLDSDGRLAGIVTDGDLRRLMEKHRGATLEMTAGAGMTRDPQTIGPQVLASEALNLMEKRKITSIVVVDEARGVLGVVHLHDLWTLELM